VVEARPVTIKPVTIKPVTIKLLLGRLTVMSAYPTPGNTSPERCFYVIV
jgi:hypothetical protein